MTTQQKELKRLRKAAKEQDWRIKKIKNGWQLLAPNGVDITTIHGSPGRHALQDAIRDMKRAGFEWG